MLLAPSVGNNNVKPDAPAANTLNAFGIKTTSFLL